MKINTRRAYALLKVVEMTICCILISEAVFKVPEPPRTDKSKGTVIINSVLIYTSLNVNLEYTKAKLVCPELVT